MIRRTNTEPHASSNNRWLVALALFSLCYCARAMVIGPYAVDPDTLHLWHLDESTIPAIDVVPGGTNLTALNGTAALGATACSGFGTALNTRGMTGNGGGVTAGLSGRPLVNGTGDDMEISYADPVTGAFTVEALVRLDFDPTTYKSASSMFIVAAENDASINRPWQFRLRSPGETTYTANPNGWRLAFANNNGSTPNGGIIEAPVPTIGPNAMVSNAWYHLAATFSGADGQLKLYWTLMHPDRIAANEIYAGGMANLNPLASAACDFAVGQVGRGSSSQNFVGLVDEIRISRIARQAEDMMFQPDSTNAAIIAEPQGEAVELGQPFSLRVVASGLTPLTYQWRFNGTPLAGATQSSHNIPSSLFIHAGNYDVIVTNSVSSVTSAVATVTVTAYEVVMLRAPQSEVVDVGEPLNLSVSASGTGPLHYQWRIDGKPIWGATLSHYNLASAQLDDWGDFDVVVTNGISMVTSGVANVSVASPGIPKLHIAPWGTRFRVSWPVPTMDWTLQRASGSQPRLVWEPSTNPPGISSNQYVVTLPTRSDGSQEFFRLDAKLYPTLTNTVIPIDWSRFAASVPTDTNAQLVAAILNNACKYALNTWWQNKYGSQDASNYLSFGGLGEAQIRPPAVQAMGLAIAIQTGAYDSTRTGRAVPEARERTLKLVRSLAYRHRANQSASGWGNDWQSALWAGAAGTAGWLLWTNLAPADQAGVQRMVESEANRFTNYAVPYYRNRAGTLLSPGDTKSEENAWDASLLHLAICMMPAHPNSTAWRKKAIEFTLSTYARPSDVSRTNIFHGRTLATWLEGSNCNEDGTLLNHSRVHPDYMAAGNSEFQPALVYLLAGKPVPQAAFFNFEHVYHAVVDLAFVPGEKPYPDGLTNSLPGGTIYQRSAAGQPTGELYFPQGNDWGTPHPMNVALLDCTAAAFALDGLASIPAHRWETQHDQYILTMQSRFTDGHTFLSSSEFSYSGREEWITDFASRSLLTKWLIHQGPVTVSNH